MRTHHALIQVLRQQRCATARWRPLSRHSMALHLRCTQGLQVSLRRVSLAPCRVCSAVAACVLARHSPHPHPLSWLYCGCAQAASTLLVNTSTTRDMACFLWPSDRHVCEAALLVQRSNRSQPTRQPEPGGQGERIIRALHATPLPPLPHPCRTPYAPCHATSLRTPSLHCVRLVTRSAFPTWSRTNIPLLTLAATHIRRG